MLSLLKKYMGKDGDFRAFIVNSTEIGRELFARIQPYPLALNLTTQAVTSALLMACDLKTKGTISIKAVGQGPLRHVTAEANSNGEARGYCGEPHLILEKKENTNIFADALGPGELSVRKRLGNSDKLYTSIVRLTDGGWAENITRFYQESDQISSGMRLGVELDPQLGIDSSGGLLIMAMPDANPEILEKLDQNVRGLKSLGSFFKGEHGFEELCTVLFKGLDYLEMSSQPVCYHCNCSRERVLDMLRSLPPDEKKDVHPKEETVAINCVFCSKEYIFQTKEI